MKINKNLTGLLAVSLLLTTEALFAKTLYVEKFGDDDGGGNTSCSKSMPCESILNALDNATPGSRVIVGPGHYVGSLTIDVDRVKLISVAGARATTIEADGFAGVTVNGQKVSVGQRGKGFTITGDFGGEDGVFVDSGGIRTRIEGNIIFYDSTDEATIEDETDAVIETVAPQSTIRYNTAHTFDYGIYSDVTGQPSKHLITDNEVSDIEGACVELYDADGARNQIKGNHLSRCGYYDAGSDYSCVAVEGGTNGKNNFSNNVLDGCGDNGFDISNASGEKSGDRYINNVVKDTSRGTGSTNGFHVNGGNPQISRNLVDNALYAIFIENTDGAVIKDNLLRNITDDALSTSTNLSFNTTFSGNTVENVGGSDGVLYITVSGVAGETPIRQMVKNNFINYAPGVEGFTLVGAGSSNMAEHAFTTSRNFWGDLNSLDGLPPLADNALTAVNDGHVKMSPSLKANPVKYKGGL